MNKDVCVCIACSAPSAADDANAVVDDDDVVLDTDSAHGRIADPPAALDSDKNTSFIVDEPFNAAGTAVEEEAIVAPVHQEASDDEAQVPDDYTEKINL